MVRTSQRNIGHLAESPVTSGVSVSTRNNTASSRKFTGLNVLCPLGDTFQCPMYYIPYMEWINYYHTILASLPTHLIMNNVYCENHFCASTTKLYGITGHCLSIYARVWICER